MSLAGRAPGRVRSDPQALGLLALLLTGVMANSSVIPFMGVYIVEGLGEPPWKISLYTTVTLLVTVAANRTLGERIDAGARIAPMLLACVLAFLAAIGAVLAVPAYWVLPAVAGVCFGLANASVSTMYSLGRLYADGAGLDIPRYNAYLRATTSIGWMIAPAAAFLIADRLGYREVFFFALGIGLVWGLVWVLAMPKGFASPPRPDVSATRPLGRNTALWLAAGICFLFAVAHVLCNNALPLFYLTEVGLPGFAPGLALSIKTAVEVVAILNAPRLVRRFGMLETMAGAALVGIASFWIIASVTSFAGLAAGAVLDGLFYGIFAGAAISFIQGHARGRMARATSLYMNSLFLGGLTAGAMMGLIAQLLSFHAAILLASFGLLAALAGLAAMRRLVPSTA